MIAGSRARSELVAARARPRPTPPAEELDPALAILVREIIGRVADKWTMLVLEVLEEHGRLRFYAAWRTRRRHQPEDADEDGAADGGGWAGGTDRLPRRSATCGVRAHGDGAELGGGVLFCVDLGGGVSRGD